MFFYQLLRGISGHLNKFYESGVSYSNSYFTMLLNFIHCDLLGLFDVDKILSHLLQLGSFHKKLQEEWTFKIKKFQD